MNTSLSSDNSPAAAEIPRIHADEQRWLAVRERRAEADGTFVYAVKTTGVYCRPVCPARLALRRNVTFFNACSDAERAGFRPCLRCRPQEIPQQERHAAAVREACRILQKSETPPALHALAAAVGLSAFHFHRLFKKTAGVTPREYAAALRTERVQAELRRAGSVTEAVCEAGFQSGSRFYEHSAETLGMTPGVWRRGGAGAVIRFEIRICALGLVLIAGTARGLCAVSFGHDRAALERELRTDFPKASIEQGDAAFRGWVKAVVDHISQPAAGAKMNLPLDLRGTAFQQRVWRALREIPPGQTAGYAEVAASIGQPAAVRAVAGACAANPVAVLVPCHRVIKTDGGMGGYRWGLERKRRLLRQESTLQTGSATG